MTDRHDPKRLAKAGIPQRFMRKTLDCYQADIPAQMEALAWATVFAQNYRTSPCGALLIGRPGTGKTHLLVGIALEALLTDYVEEIHYTTVEKLIRRVKDSFSPRSEESEKQVRKSVTEPRLLILEEVGVQFGTDFEFHLLSGILNDRYENQKPTILSSNLSQPEVAKYLGERVIDRLREDGSKVLVFDWESHRGTGDG